MPIAKRWKNGRWQWCADYRDSNDRRVQKFFTTKEQAEEHFAHGVIDGQQKTTCDLPTTITLGQYAEHWQRLQTHLKQATLDCYDQQLRLHLSPAFAGVRVRDLHRGRLKAFLARQLQDHSRNTVRLMHATVRVILNAAVDDGLIVANPADKLGRALKLVARTTTRRLQPLCNQRARDDAVGSASR
ncbi:MAG TPA: hypothetical protein VKU61_02385 [Candidatus Binatia bacterium]|nr:hypothetical protein [Candidatus Binatia bacterium]